VVTVTGAGDDQRVEVELGVPAYGIAPGQAVVVYDGTRVVGSATIAATARATSASGAGTAAGAGAEER
jgi:tRNA-specific 2-thiouridylase